MSKSEFASKVYCCGEQWMGFVFNSKLKLSEVAKKADDSILKRKAALVKSK